MKKYLITISLIIICTIIFAKKTKATYVFNELETKNSNSAEYFYLKDKNNNLNTNNLLEIINSDNIKIIGIYPNTNDIYEPKLKENLQYYNFSLINNNSTNIKRFINYYVSSLKNNNYIEQANLVYFNGIKIEKILIYTTYNYLNELKSNNKNLTYQIREL